MYEIANPQQSRFFDSFDSSHCEFRNEYPVRKCRNGYSLYHTVSKAMVLNIFIVLVLR